MTAPRLDFGNEVWCGDHTFKVAFREPFNIAFYKDAYVVDHLEFSSDSHQWNTLILSERHKIGKSISLPHSLICCTPSD